MLIDRGYREGGYDGRRYLIFKRARDEDAIEVNGRHVYGYCRAEPDAVYFPLRVDSDPHARKALAVYANSVEEENPLLASELRLLIDSTHPAFLDNLQRVP